MEELQTLSLIKRDSDTRTLSVHRLIQSHFKQFLGNEGRQRAHINISKLLYLAFPQRESTNAQFHDRWQRCSRYMPHVISLKNAFGQERKKVPGFEVCPYLVEVLVNCQR